MVIALFNSFNYTNNLLIWKERRNKPLETILGWAVIGLAAWLIDIFFVETLLIYNRTALNVNVSFGQLDSDLVGVSNHLSVIFVSEAPRWVLD